MRSAAVSLAVLLLLIPHAAHAALSLCNRTSYILYAATAEQHSGEFSVHGWTRLAPGACGDAITGNLGRQPVYVTAHSSRAHAGPVRNWGGDSEFCVRDGDFSRRQSQAGLVCADDEISAPFARVETHQKRAWTMTFNDAPEQPTLLAAQLAGVKRLLKDLGARGIGVIDGIPDKATEAALQKFRATSHLRPTATNDDLFNALEREAMQTVSPAGYAVCNDTAAPLFVAEALGSGGAKDAHSIGWWKIAAKTCARTIADPLSTDKVFLRAEQGGKPLVQGPAKFCVTNVEFDIHGKGACASRGLIEAGFAETATRGLSGYVARIGQRGLMRVKNR